MIFFFFPFPRQLSCQFRLPSQNTADRCWLTKQVVISSPGSREKSSGVSSSSRGLREGLPLLQESDPRHLQGLQTASQWGYGRARILTDTTFSPQEGLQIPGPPGPTPAPCPAVTLIGPGFVAGVGKGYCV